MSPVVTTNFLWLQFLSDAEAPAATTLSALAWLQYQALNSLDLDVPPPSVLPGLGGGFNDGSGNNGQADTGGQPDAGARDTTVIPSTTSKT
jgi:hypothetical protein